jgi:hypothetical protein
MSETTETTADLNAALAKAQAQMKPAAFNRTNPHFKTKYADLAAVIAAIREPLASNGLAFAQTMYISDRGPVLLTTLRHASGQCLTSEYPLPNGVKPQEFGAALTYARRYSLSCITGIAADDDDDGNGANTISNGKDKTSGNGGVVSDEQAETIWELIRETNTNVDVFLKWANAPSISDIKASAYANIISKLQQKKAAV